MVVKEPTSEEKVTRLRNKTRSRKDQADLRKKVLKDQTCKHLNFSPTPAKLLEKKVVNKDGLKPLKIGGKENEPAAATGPPSRMSCEEKTLLIRRKLEKIIHKKEENESKAVEMLLALERMKYTPAVLESTKICFTIEAFKLVVKDKSLITKADNTLAIIKASVPKEKVKVQIKTYSDRRDEKENVKTQSEIRDGKEKEKVKGQTERREVKDKVQTDRREKAKSKTELRDKRETNKKEAPVEPSVDKPEIKSYTEWRDEKEKERKQQIKQDKIDEEEKRKLYEKKKRDYERHKYEHEKKERDFERRMKAHDLRKEKEAEPEPAIEAVAAEGLGDALPSMRIGYWMDKLMSGVDQLSLLDRKVGKIEENVKKINPEDAKMADIRKVKDKSANKDVKTQSETPSAVLEDELFMLTKNLQKITVQEKPKVTEPISSKEEIKKKLPTKPKETPSADIARIKQILDTPGNHDTTIVIENLKILSSMSMTITTLQTSKIGVSLNNLRKSTTEAQVVEISKTILKSWKKLLPSDSTEIAKTSEKAEEEKENIPQPVKNSPAEIRKYCKNKLLSALGRNQTLSSSCKLFAEELATKIEEEIFKLFNETSPKYRAQVNSRYFNILGNWTLQENLLLGNLEPRDVATMNYEDMAPEQMKETRAKWIEEGLKTVPECHVADASCTCRICLPPWISQ